MSTKQESNIDNMTKEKAVELYECPAQEQSHHSNQKELQVCKGWLHRVHKYLNIHNIIRTR